LGLIQWLDELVKITYLRCRNEVLCITWIWVFSVLVTGFSRPVIYCEKLGWGLGSWDLGRAVERHLYGTSCLEIASLLPLSSTTALEIMSFTI
jgi:hypothetical protein